MDASVSYRGAISNILKYNLEPNTLLFSNEDGKIQALDLPSNYLTYLDRLRDNIQDQIDEKSNKSYLDSLFYTKIETDGIISNLIDSAPEQLNTLNELSQALNNDENFATNIINLINTKSNITDVDDKFLLYYTKLQVDDFVTALNDDITNLYSVVSPYEVGVNAYSFLNIPTDTIPLCVRSSDKTEQIANFYDNQIVFYKQIVFTPDCTFSGDNAPYTITQVNNIMTQLNTDLDTRFNLYYTKIDSDNLYYTKTYINTLIDLYYTKIQSDNLYYNKTYINDLIDLYYTKIQSDNLYYNKTYINDLIALYYTKIQSDDLYYTKTYINTNIYTKTQSDINYYTKNYIDNNLYLKTDVFNKAEINDKFLPFNTALNLTSGPYYYNLPLNSNGILIWDEPTQKTIAQFKLNLSKFMTDVEMTGDLKVDTLSGNVLTQLDTFVKNISYTKLQVDDTIDNYFTKTQTNELLLPLQTDTTNLKSVIYRTLNWTGGLVIKYPEIGALGFNNYLDEVTALFDVNDLSFYKTVKCFANVEAINFDIKCKTLSGSCLTQIDNMIKALCYTVNDVDSIVSGLTNLINAKQDILNTKMGDGVDLLFSPSVLSKVIAGNNISILRVFNPGQLDDGQIRFDVDLSNYYNKNDVFNKLQINEKFDLYYNKDTIDTKLTQIIGAAPSQLNTLYEIANALNNDANLYTTLTNLINTKANADDVYDKAYINNNVYLKTSLFTQAEINAKFDLYYNKTWIDTNVYTKLQTTAITDPLNSKITKLLNVVSPYEVGVNAYSFLNIPTSTIPLCIRSSDAINQIANFYDNQIVFYKQIVFTPDCTFSGANAPYTITQIDDMLTTNFFTKADINAKFNLYYNKEWIDTNVYTQSQITSFLANKQNTITSITGDGVDLFYSSTQLSKLTGGTNVTVSRINTPGSSADKQVLIDVSLSNYYTSSYIDNNFYTKANTYTRAEITASLNTKQNNITGAATSILTSDLSSNFVLISSAGKVAVSTVTTTKLGYLSDVTGNIQGQLALKADQSTSYLKSEVNSLLDLKQNSISGAATTILSADLSTNLVLISNASGKVAVSGISDTKLGYLSDVTSNIQAQLNSTSNIVKFVSGTGNVFYTPTVGSNLGAVIMTPDTGSIIAIFKHDLIFCNKNIDNGGYDIKALTLSGGCLTQIANIALTNCYSKTQIDSNLYTQTQVNNLLTPITDDTSKLKAILYRPLNWTGTVILRAGNNLGIAINNYLDQTMAMFNVNDNEFYKLTKFYANIDCTNYDVKCNTLSGNCLTQIAGITPTNCYTKTQVDGYINTLTTNVTALQTSDATQQSLLTSLNDYYVKVSGVVALSTTVPDVYLQIPPQAFISVRKSDYSADLVIFNDAGATFNTSIVLNNGATILGTGAPYTKTEVNTALAGKQATITGAATTVATSDLTINRALISDANGKIAVSGISDVKLGYLSDVTSAIQTQLNSKQATITVSANKALVSDANGKVIASPYVTATEVTYLYGVTDYIQPQIGNLWSSLNAYAGFINGAGTINRDNGYFTFTLSRPSTGVFTITFSIALSNNQYCVQATPRVSTPAIVTYSNQTTTACTFYVFDNTGTAQNYGFSFNITVK